MQIAELQVRALYLCNHPGRPERFFVICLLNYQLIPFATSCAPVVLNRSRMGFGVERAVHLYHMQWNPQEFRSSGLGSQVS